MKMDELIQLNKVCRENKIAFILTEAFGAAAFAFVDFGDKHVVTDLDGEPCKQFIISGIDQAESVVTVHEDKRHSF